MNHDEDKPKGKCDELLIDLLTNWGNSTFIGLTEIKLFDENLQEIFLEFSDLFLLKNQKEKESVHLKNIIDNDFQTTDDHHMFKNYFRLRNTLTIKIMVPQSVKLAFIVIWNYNKELDVGVKNCKMFFKNLKVFEGHIN